MKCFFGFQVCFLILFVPIAWVQADVTSLAGLESYDTNFVDVTLQGTVGSWTKVDSPNPVTDQGELVTSGPFAGLSPRTGNVFLDLRTENQYHLDDGGADDGANYNYALNSSDFGGLAPASVSNGTVEMKYWMCPDTWSNDIGFFIPASAGVYQSTSLRNGNGDVLVSLGVQSLGNQNSPEVYYSVDNLNWTSTGLLADNGSWTEVSLFVDLDNQISRVGFTDSNANSFTSADLAWISGISDKSVQALNFEMMNGVGKHFFDDFAFSVVTVPVPEPTHALIGAIGLVAFTIRRRRASR